eukprot:6169674-Pleurochrysis_carterae.AAC.1
MQRQGLRSPRCPGKDFPARILVCPRLEAHCHRDMWCCTTPSSEMKGSIHSPGRCPRESPSSDAPGREGCGARGRHRRERGDDGEHAPLRVAPHRAERRQRRVTRLQPVQVNALSAG